ncbi:MAG: hypothetical protein JRD89_04985 [Deltaproteobacteria bacterium]|nr:hypothetical protein [Deltaproteobacteria bacterium]
MDRIHPKVADSILDAAKELDRIDPNFYTYDLANKRVASPFLNAPPITPGVRKPVSARNMKGGTMEKMAQRFPLRFYGSSQPGTNYRSSAPRYKNLGAGFPYEQELQNVLASAPEYAQPSETELAKRARQWAELQINPQQQALQRTLEQTRQAYGAQKRSTEAAYAGSEETTRRLMQEAAADALESAIARGGGRSGAVEWLTEKLQRPVVEQFTQTQAEKAARLADIADKLALAETQTAAQEQQLAEKAGLLEASRLAELRDMAHATAMGDWESVMQATQNLADIAIKAQQLANEKALREAELTGTYGGAPTLAAQQLAQEKELAQLPYEQMTKAEEAASKISAMDWVKDVVERFGLPPDEAQDVNDYVNWVSQRQAGATSGGQAGATSGGAGTPVHTFKQGDVKIVNGTAYAPIRDIARIFGGKVDWKKNSAGKVLVHIKKGSHGSGYREGLDGAFVKNGTFYAPVRQVLREWDYEVKWDPQTKQIYVYKR